ncbi:hypothetical protein [Mycolicibacterium phlei]
MRSLDRRWWVAIGVVVIALIALIYSRLTAPPEECKPVLDLLEYNKSQGELIREKTENDEGMLTAADEIAYQAWADGLAERARNIDRDELRIAAVEVADLAEMFVRKLPEVRAAAESRAPGAPTPPVVFELAALDDRIQRKLADLADACKA